MINTKPITVSQTTATLKQMIADYGEPIWEHRDGISRLYAWLTDDERITFNTATMPATVSRESR